ncbi:ribose-phosphate diphosphokinase [Candidatus Woesearchaeota archaeon]|nr:ribose-phosphate diphosphokinase [Candidatus Woesearchaeota archaeon]
MIITSCGNSEYIARGLAKKLKAKYSPLTIAAFPDGDLYLRFNASLQGKKVVIVQSFYPHPDMSLFDVVFASKTARELGAKKIILVAPYLAYMRQDKRFHPGECVSSMVMAGLLNDYVDKIITIDPHLHRYKSLKNIFKISAVRLTANGLLGEYIKKKYQPLRNNLVVIGPDWESYQWAEDIAQIVGVPATVLEKTRLSSWEVHSKMVHPIPIKGKDVVIVDDIISTGRTIAEAARQAKSMGAKSIRTVGVHGIFVEDAIEKMKKAGVVDIVSTNCIDKENSKIDVTPLLVEELKKER